MAIPQDFPYRHSGNVELFDQFASLDILTLTSGEVLNFRVPVNAKVSWLTQFGHGIDDLNAFLLSIFSIRINGNSDRIYGNIQDQIGLFSDPRNIQPIKLKSGDVVTVIATNNTAATRKYSARLKGFFDFITRPEDAGAGK